jgi:hypothetical protein
LHLHFLAPIFLPLSRKIERLFADEKQSSHRSNFQKISSRQVQQEHGELGQKIENPKSFRDFSDRCVAKESLSIRELTDILKFAG